MFDDPTFPVNAALEEGVRVKLNSSGELVAASATETEWIGHTARKTFAAGDRVAVRSRGRILEVTAAAAITIYSRIYTDASGKWNDSAPENSSLGGVALEAAAADGATFRAMIF